MLNGKTAVVTGASRGLGRAIAIELARAGARVVLAARSVAGLKETADLIGADALTVSCDVAQPDDTVRLRAAVEAWTDRVDILINNAGVLEPLGNFAEVDFEDWAESMNINVMGTASVTHALLPLMTDGPQDATIVTISSGAAVSNIAGWSAYCTAKSALDRWAMILDEELKAKKVRSFSFAPGTIDTHMQAAIRTTRVGPARLVNGEVTHQPPEVPAKAVAFLCTPEASGLAGQHIDIRYPEVRQALGLPPLS